MKYFVTTGNFVEEFSDKKGAKMYAKAHGVKIQKRRRIRASIPPTFKQVTKLVKGL